MPAKYPPIPRNPNANDSDTSNRIDLIHNSNIDDRDKKSGIANLLRRNSVTKKMQLENKRQAPETQIDHKNDISALTEQILSGAITSNKAVDKSHDLQRVPSKENMSRKSSK